MRIRDLLGNLLRGYIALGLLIIGFLFFGGGYVILSLLEKLGVDIDRY